MNLLHFGVLGAALWCLLALVWEFLRARAFGKRRYFSKPAGDPAAGVRYAFLQGMAPQAKESVMLHLPSYGAGLMYHAGIFAAFALLAARISGVGLPSLAVWLLAGLGMGGALGGGALLLKRCFQPHLRGISNADDFLANALVTAFAALASGAAWVPGLEGVWMLEGIVLLLYVPLGKIRHCLFFFPTRYCLGAFLGHRGVFPPAPRKRHA
jgi:hypothetical protein